MRPEKRDFRFMGLFGLHFGKRKADLNRNLVLGKEVLISKISDNFLL